MCMCFQMKEGTLLRWCPYPCSLSHWDSGPATLGKPLVANNRSDLMHRVPGGTCSCPPVTCLFLWVFISVAATFTEFNTLFKGLCLLLDLTTRKSEQLWPQDHSWEVTPQGYKSGHCVLWGTSYLYCIFYFSASLWFNASHSRRQQYRIK